MTKRLLLILTIVLLLAACSREQQRATPGVTQGVSQPTAGVEPTAAAESPSTAPADGATAVALAGAGTPADTAVSTTLPAPAGDTFQNPVIRDNFADPFLFEEEGAWYAYATNAAGKNVPLAKSENLVKWTQMTDAMPSLAKWARPGGSLVWAPEVIEAEGKYLLYYTARDKASNRQCVGVAVADKPTGKFRDTRDSAFVCQAKEGGTIDASPFRDADGKLYLYYKNDGNCCGIPTYLYVQEMTPDGQGFAGEPVRLVRNDKQWEGGVVEAPTMWEREGSYYLFFSANNYAGHEYAVGYATCEGPLGPCTDAPENPILKSVLQKPPNMVIGPGHQTLIKLDGQDWIVYHVWETVGGGRRGDRRQVWLDQLDWDNGKPVVEGPTVAPQPAPMP